MISRSDIDLLKWRTVKVSYRTEGNSIPRTWTGTLIGSSLRCVLLESRTGRRYKIPLEAVIEIKEAGS